MIATNALVQAMANLLAADPLTLSSVTALHLHLAAAPFTPSANLALGGLTEATFTGGAALDAGIGDAVVFVDPLTGLINLELLEPPGGWHWQCTVTPSPSQTIYGVYLTDTANAVLWGSQLLPQPVTISAAGQGLDFANAKFQMVQTPFGVAQ